mgnify:CR=1 FL=1
MDNKKNLRNLAIYLGVPIIIIVIMASIYSNVKPQKTHKYSEIINYFKDQQVTDYTMDLGSGEMAITLKDGTKVSYTAPNVGLLNDEIMPYVHEYDDAHPSQPMVRDLKRPAETSWIASLIPTLLLLAGMVVFWWFMMKRLNSTMGDAGKQMNFGKAKVKQCDQHENSGYLAEFIHDHADAFI